MSDVVEVRSRDEVDRLVSETPYVLIDFYADWCGPCKAIAPLYKQLASARGVEGKFVFAEVDVDAVSDVAEKYGVAAMPTFKLFKDGAVANGVLGANAAALKAVVETIPADAEAGEGTNDETVSGNYTMTSGTRTDWKMSLEG